MNADQGGVLTARWSGMAVLNFESPPELLGPFLPSGLELAAFDNRHLLSMVAFRFADTRMNGRRVPFYGNFIELFLGFQAQRTVADGSRRAWVFVRKIVPSAMVATVGRLLYNEDYIRRPMRVDLQEGSDAPIHARYAWQNRGRWNTLYVEAEHGRPEVPAAGTVEAFVTDNYGGFSKRRSGRTIEFHVAHPPWQVWRARDARLDCDIDDIYGPEFGEVLSREPHSAFLASGSDVTLGKPYLI